MILQTSSSSSSWAHLIYLLSSSGGLFCGAKGKKKDRRGGGDCHPLCFANARAAKEKAKYRGGMVLQVQVPQLKSQQKWMLGAQVSKVLRCDRVWNIFFCHEVLTLPRRPYFARNSSRRWAQSNSIQQISIDSIHKYVSLSEPPFRFFVALQVLFKSLWGRFHRKFGAENFNVDQNLTKLPQVSQLDDELHSLIRNSKTTVKSLEDFIRSNAKDLHTKHYLNLMGNFHLTPIFLKMDVSTIHICFLDITFTVSPIGLNLFVIKTFGNHCVFFYIF